MHFRRARPIQLILGLLATTLFWGGYPASAAPVAIPPTTAAPAGAAPPPATVPVATLERFCTVAANSGAVQTT